MPLFCNVCSSDLLVSIPNSFNFVTAVLPAINESSVIFFVAFLPLPCQYHQQIPEAGVCCLI
jgi:hypothetical protein